MGTGGPSTVGQHSLMTQCSRLTRPSGTSTKPANKHDIFSSVGSCLSRYEKHKRVGLHLQIVACDWTSTHDVTKHPYRNCICTDTAARLAGEMDTRDQAAWVPYEGGQPVSFQEHLSTVPTLLKDGNEEACSARFLGHYNGCID